MDDWPLFFCDYCENDASAVRFACAECPDFDLCVECFLSGAEIGQHKKTHAFNLAYYAPLIPSQPHWSALEELKLVCQVVQHGYGNWKTIAASLNSKSAEEIEKHFHHFYVDGNLGRVIRSSIEPSEIADHTKDFKVDADPPETSCENLPELVYKETGYMPRRGEFMEVEQEYDSQAETELRDMLAFEDDDKLYSAMRLSLIDMYRDRVEKRDKVKKLLWEYDLIKKFEASTSKTQHARMDKDESILREKFKTFCRFMPVAEHEDLISKMIEEKRIKARIKELQAEIQKRCSKDSLKPVEKNPTKGKSKATKPRKAALSASPSNLRPAAAAGRKEVKSDVAVSSDTRPNECAVSDSAKEPSSIDYANFLSKAEKRLCSNLSMEPSCYMALKTTFLKERNVLKENGSVSVSSKFPKEMSDRVQHVAQFMEQSGWINPG